jgi:hypothetical protein
MLLATSDELRLGSGIEVKVVMEVRSNNQKHPEANIQPTECPKIRWGRDA